MQQWQAGGTRAAFLARRYLRALAMPFLALAFFAAGCLANPAFAGELDKAALAKHFPEPFYLGERDATLPIWPLFRHNIPQSDDFVGYVFESIDLAPIAGYAGKPVNMLIAINPEGNFISASVISHYEPIFNHGVSEDTLFKFVEQYRGMSLKQNLKVNSSNSNSQGQGASTKYIDGVAKATVSVRIINETVLTASLKVARAKLKLGLGSDPGRAPTLKPDNGQTATEDDLTKKDYLHKAVINNADVDKSFGPAFPTDADVGARFDPKAPMTELWVSYLRYPEIGRAIMGEKNFAALMKDFRPTDHAILVATRGRYSFQSPQYRIGGVPDLLSIMQSGLAININMALVRYPPITPSLPNDVTWTVLKVLSESGFDPSQPWQLALTVNRQKGSSFPVRSSKDFTVAYQVPAEFFIPAPVELSGWQAVLFEQWPKISLTLSQLLFLTVLLTNTRRLSATPKYFQAVRFAFLATTLVGIGWWAQGQLSINNILGVINAARSTGDFGFLLLDPVSTLLWGFVLISLVVWGRGTFCGWLCPFGALQEFAAYIGGRLKLPQVQIPYAVDRVLRLTKYLILAAIIGTAFFSTPVAEGIAEVEPFKTAITLGFDRAWPYVLYASAILVLSAFVFKGFCLYLCPLGAALALLGRARAFNWIPRRKECGTPCQLCSKRCSYGAIEPTGKIKYDECFQCMDCVNIYHDPKACVPVILARKGRTLNMPVPAGARRKEQSQPKLPEFAA
jgi:NosR/NirI family transcriptional regulator, nitrous oxide reductase regulator